MLYASFVIYAMPGDAESEVFLGVGVIGCGEPAVSTVTGPHLAGPPLKWVCSWGGAGASHRAIGEKVQL